MTANAAPPVLDVRNLSIAVDNDGLMMPITEEVSFTIGRGEVLALVGESGSGKSVTALSLMQLLGAGLKVVSGEIRLEAQGGFSAGVARRWNPRCVDPGHPRRPYGDDLSGNR